jgi:hypothetical protein
MNNRATHPKYWALRNILPRINISSFLKTHDDDPSMSTPYENINKLRIYIKIGVRNLGKKIFPVYSSKGTEC